MYGRGDNQWRRFRSHLKGVAYGSRPHSRRRRSALSIPVARVVDQIEDRAGAVPVVERLSSMLYGWDQVPGRSGLPQRFIPSSALASMYSRSRGRRACPLCPSPASPELWRPDRASRWMDDIWVFGSDPSLLWKAQLELQQAMRELGLQMGLGKTSVLEGDEMLLEVQRREHSAVDVELASDEPSVASLNELIDQLLSGPRLPTARRSASSPTACGGTSSSTEFTNSSSTPPACRTQPTYWHASSATQSGGKIWALVCR